MFKKVRELYKLLLISCTAWNKTECVRRECVKVQIWIRSKQAHIIIKTSPKQLFLQEKLSNTSHLFIGILTEKERILMILYLAIRAHQNEALSRCNHAALDWSIINTFSSLLFFFIESHHGEEDCRDSHAQTEDLFPQGSSGSHHGPAALQVHVREASDNATVFFLFSSDFIHTGVPKWLTRKSYSPSRRKSQGDLKWNR